ncbi:MAG TPA: DNA replication/repair protein RecF [Bacteroidota bacterium]
MRFREVRLQNFRNHTSTTIACASKRNVFLGNNGEGKTNILEAISYLCLTKSFYALSDTTAVQLGQPGFGVSASAVSDIDVPYEIELSYDKENREKKIVINKGAVVDRSSVIGAFPVVVLSPENSNVTSGTPADRRRFMDIVISQSSRPYLEDLMEYRRILRQRNRILLEGKTSQRLPVDVLEPWNENLIKCGSRISHRRAQFVDEFSPYLVDAFVRIAENGERPAIQYDSSIVADSTVTVENAREVYRNALAVQFAEEKKLGTTLVGPHKDELVFEIGGLGLKAYASQGQHKTFLVALKVAEFFYLRERCRETPVLLLDDVFSELDEFRSARLLSLTENLGQTFITATDERRFTGRTNRGSEICRFRVRGGKVASAKPAVLTN